MIVVLDSGPLGLLSYPSANPVAEACNLWLDDLVGSLSVVVPEIVDYELRRELLRMGKAKSLKLLDRIAYELEFLPLSTGVLRTAAELWAETRRVGRPTAHPDALDIDVILAAQALSLIDRGDVVVATTNKRHLERFVRAEHWNEIR